MKKTLIYSTELGQAYHGNSAPLLRSLARNGGRESVQLIFTSPPFVLNTKKKYGNLTGKEYVTWLKGFASLFADLLTADGSIVIEIGNGWEQGQPTMSTLPLEALLAFKKAGRFHLCQEFICFNPARLPSPAQWVNVERSRVKDAFTRVWWLSRTPRPKADNRHVLTMYSDSMNKLLEKGTYNSGLRPSEFNIGETSFLKNNSGAIPPNVLAASIVDTMAEIAADPMNVFSIANTKSNDPYQVHCREKNVTPHPARMPSKLVEFFVKFLTDANDLVLDPFAGSNTTGAVAESLGRRWKAFEINSDYLEASKARFPGIGVKVADQSVKTRGTRRPQKK
ncbi:MAG: site-specific DNA-methyltransferase [Edaphobacter sp.]